VYKTFSDTDNAAAEAAGLYDHVLFTLQNKTDGLYMKAELKEDEGIWYVTGTTEAEADATKMHPATWNNQDGCLVIKGLEAGEYILTEKETASGYTPLEESITIKIVAENDPDTACAPQAKTEHMLYSASASVNDQNIDMNNDETNPQSENALVPLRIENKRGFNLPQTGELGARLLPIIGGGLLGIVAIASVALFVFLRRKNKTA